MIASHENRGGEEGASPPMAKTGAGPSRSSKQKHAKSSRKPKGIEALQARYEKLYRKYEDLAELYDSINGRLAALERAEDLREAETLNAIPVTVPAPA